MQCPNCCDEEIHGSGFNRVIKKVHLDMERVCCEDGYDFFQCPRCAMTRKRKSKFLSSGPIESSSPDEAKKAAESSSGALAAVVGIGLAILVIGAVASSNTD